MKKSLPKVLIIGETFRGDTGGGITISNLFRNWAKEDLAVITDVLENDFDKCNNYYYLGNKENQNKWPFHYIYRKTESGEISSSNKRVLKKNGNNNFSIKVRQTLKRVLGFLSHFLGLHHYMHNYNISEALLKWIKKFNPDLIYVQPNSLAIVLLVNQLNDLLKKNMAVHIVDDYIGTKNKFGLFYSKYEKKIKREYAKLVNNAIIHFSISHEMTINYKSRFNINFTSIHNPVNKDKWMFPITNLEVSGSFKIIYAGRIGIANLSALIKLSTVVDLINKENIPLSFNIYSIDENLELIRHIKSKKGTYLKGFIEHENLAKIMSLHDLLFLPLSITNKSKRYTKLSMPTKVSEYMMIGKPILVFAPEESALYQYSIKEKWAYTVSENKIQSLSKAIKTLYENILLRKKIAQRAQELALENHELNKVNDIFENTIMQKLNLN